MQGGRCPASPSPAEEQAQLCPATACSAGAIVATRWHPPAPSTGQGPGWVLAQTPPGPLPPAGFAHSAATRETTSKEGELGACGSAHRESGQQHSTAPRSAAQAAQTGGRVGGLPITRPPAQPGRQRRLCTGWSSRTWPAAERYLPALSQHQQLSSSAPPAPTSTTLPASSSPQPKPRAPRQPSPCAMCVLWAASGTVGGARTEARTHSLHWARPCHSWSWALLHLGNDHHSLTHTQCHAMQTDQAQLACRTHALTALGINRSSTANAKSALLNANKYKPRAGLGPAALRLRGSATEHTSLHTLTATH